MESLRGQGSQRTRGPPALPPPGSHWASSTSSPQHCHPLDIHQRPPSYLLLVSSTFCSGWQVEAIGQNKGLVELGISGKHILFCKKSLYLFHVFVPHPSVLRVILVGVMGTSVHGVSFMPSCPGVHGHCLMKPSQSVEASGATQ